MRQFAAALGSAVLLLATACSAPDSRESVPRLESAEAPSPTASSLVELTNAARARAGLRPLRINTQLMRAAEIHAEQMAAAGRMAHTLSNARYVSMDDRLTAVGYRWQAAGENLAFGQRGTAEVVAGWMQSPAHRANILATHFTEIGTGHIVDSSGRAYYVQVFGAPATIQEASRSR